MEKWSLTVKELPRELISTRSLFHPFSTYTFSLYNDDSLGVMKSCIEWKLRIPFDYVELYTTAGVPLTDACTLMREKECIFVDARVTNKFFETEYNLKNEIEEISKEPLILHKMALHGMNMAYLKGTFKDMDEILAQKILKEDLSVSGTIASKILMLIKKK